MNKKEMGITVKGLVEYASECFGNGDYKEMVKTFDIALSIANMYELYEYDWVKRMSDFYMLSKNDFSDCININLLTTFFSLYFFCAS